MKTGHEIEQKFLLKDNFHEDLTDSKILVQSYFQENGTHYRIRLDLTDQKAIIAHKGPSELIDGALVRLETENEVDFEKWKPLVLEKNNFLIKKRHFLNIGEQTFEIDNFLNLKKPYENLWLCEIEFSNLDELKKFNHNPKPDWLGNNVSGLSQFENYNLFKFIKPYNIERGLSGKYSKI